MLAVTVSGQSGIPCDARSRGEVRRTGNGDVLICTAGVWKHHWRQLTVRL